MKQLSKVEKEVSLVSWGFLIEPDFYMLCLKRWRECAYIFTVFLTECDESGMMDFCSQKVHIWDSMWGHNYSLGAKVTSVNKMEKESGLWKPILKTINL